MAKDNVPVPTEGGKVPAPPNPDVPRPNETLQEYKIRIYTETQVYKGSRYPPFSIEHKPLERQRLATPMTAEDRFLRKQWLHDQVLVNTDSRYIEQVYPRNIFRRIYRKPWDLIEQGLRNVVSPSTALRIRVMVPKLMIFAVSIAAVYYHLRFNYKTWESFHGADVYISRPPKYPGQDASTFPSQPIFGDCNFSRRKSLRD
ncbi:uncharacterized protein LOC127873891 [Dreissena polymorpha]|uniref:NADH dehydrogenase [ubiquinone] 1 beta subcomplex subunit 6 n=1 Tax=Dreissena polymorpha TaxID=45954 RepID=A0A9D4QYL7_DREPO|nr:uncharacterized protein LOC127873662 [Dreissena polymorpha]XP_052273953.1 uncharacterized protein LOC127873891 [Dreissena polymorpha]KAH3847551.1 hypothetical protein DPMN_089876 [Dreissena polymorpha]KAH3847577.1 hypothetical protein DPMN_089903 [Dreissena polymorpha]